MFNFDFNKIVSYKSSQVHRFEALGMELLTVRVKAGYDTDGNRKPDLHVHATGPGGVDVLKETYDLPELDPADALAVYNFVVSKIENATGLDLPGGS